MHGEHARRKEPVMKLPIRHTAPAVVVAVALGASATLLVASASGGAGDAKPPPEATSTCKPAPARCGSEDKRPRHRRGERSGATRARARATGSTTDHQPGACGSPKSSSASGGCLEQGRTREISKPPATANRPGEHDHAELATTLAPNPRSGRAGNPHCGHRPAWTSAASPSPAPPPTQRIRRLRLGSGP